MNVLFAIAFRRGPRRAVLAAAAAALLIFFSPAFSGTSAASTGASGQATAQKPLQYQVTISVKLVQVYVTAKGGVPVSDLAASDFAVFDNGKSYPVTHFEKHFLETGEAVISTPASPEIAAPMNRKFFLVFDFAFMDPKAMLRAKSAALKFLDGGLQPTDEIGVVSYQATRGLVLNEYLTTDHARVRAIVESFGARAKAGRAENLTQFIYSTDLPVLAADERATNQGAAVDVNSQFYESQAKAQAGQAIGPAGRQNYVDQARQLMVALGQMAKVLRAVPGFKNIVLFSGGIASQYLYGKRGGATLGEWTTPEQLASQLGGYDGAQASATLRDDYSAMVKDFKASNCPVYTVDVSRERMKGDVQTQTGVSSESLREFEGEDSLRQIASGTGGKFFAKTMEEERVVEDIQGATSAYYVLGYEVPETYDGKFHKIKVEVGRKGLDVITQGGYFGAKPFKEFTRFEKLMHVVDVALSETPGLQVPLDMPVLALPLTVRGWSQALVFARASQAVLAEVLGNKAEAYLLLIDDKGDVASIKRFALPAQATGKETLFPSFLLPVKPGRYSGRIVLRNLETGRAARTS